MREYLDRFAAKEDRGDAVPAVRGHNDKVTAFRRRGIDDRLVGVASGNGKYSTLRVCGARSDSKRRIDGYS